MSNMRIQRPFEVVTPTVDGVVLQVLAGANSAFTITQIHRLAGEFSEAGVRKAVYRLVEQGIVTEFHVGRTGAYELNREHLAADAIIAIAQSGESLLGRLREHLARFTKAAAFGALFGSAARSDMRTSSDIDLLLVRPADVEEDNEIWLGEIGELERKVTRWTGNDTRVIVVSESELTRPGFEPDPLLKNVAKNGLVVAGRADYLQRVAKG